MNETYPLALPPGTALIDQYVIDAVLGQGGFGITYKATEKATGQAVAIKEFFPDALATRTGSTVSSFPGERATNYSYGLDCFLEEAKTLAQFGSNPGVVNIRNYFECNSTAYFVMDFIEGKSFEEMIKENGGHIEYAEAEKVLLPVIEALSAVHSQGIIHRDVTPDNIYITKEGDVKLLDFGAARYSLGDKSRSLDVVLKHGYAPKEQYSRHGRQGPYTDVYTVGACFYVALSGRRPPDSIDRLEEDDLVPLSTLGVKIEPGKEEAILKAMAVQPADRFKTMDEFKAALMGEVAPGAAASTVAPQSSPASQTVAPAPASAEKTVAATATEKTDRQEAAKEKKKKPLVPIIIGASVLALAAVGIFVLPKLFGSSGNGQMEQQVDQQTDQQKHAELNFNNLFPGGYAAETNDGVVYYVREDQDAICLIKNQNGMEEVLDRGSSDIHELCVWGEDVVYVKDDARYRYSCADGSITKAPEAFANAENGPFRMDASHYLILQKDGHGDRYSFVMLSENGDKLGSVATTKNEFIAIIDDDVYFVGTSGNLCKSSVSGFGNDTVELQVDGLKYACGLTAYNGKLYFACASDEAVIYCYDPKKDDLSEWGRFTNPATMGISEMSILNGDLYLAFNNWSSEANYSTEIRKVNMSSLEEEIVYENYGACSYCLGFSEQLNKFVFGYFDGKHVVTEISIK